MRAVRPLLLIVFSIGALACCGRAAAQLQNGNQWPHPRLNCADADRRQGGHHV